MRYGKLKILQRLVSLEFQILSGTIITQSNRATQIARFMGPTWGPPGSCRPQMGPMYLAIREDIVNSTTATGAEHISESELTKDDPYLALKGKLRCVYWKGFEDNWLCYTSTMMYTKQLKIQTSLVITCSNMTWYCIQHRNDKSTLIARFVEPTWGSSGTDRTQVGPMLAPWTSLSG